MEDHDIRAALDRHWAASDANDFETEHQIYREDAVLEYPQSGERIRGRRNIQASRFAQPSRKRFTVRRILGAADLCVADAGSHPTRRWREMDSNFRFRAGGDTPHRPRGEAASHRSRLPLRRDPPSGRDLDDGTVSQLLEELAGEMNRPSDRKRRISGYGDRTWRRKADE